MSIYQDIDTIVDNYINNSIGSLIDLRNQLKHLSSFQLIFRIKCSKLFSNTSNDLAYNIKLYVLSDDHITRDKYIVNILCCTYNDLTDEFLSIITDDFIHDALLTKYISTYSDSYLIRNNDAHTHIPEYCYNKKILYPLFEIKNGEHIIIQMMKRVKTDPSLYFQNGKKLLLIAAIKQFYELIYYLLDSGASHLKINNNKNKIEYHDDYKYVPSENLLYFSDIYSILIDYYKKKGYITMVKCLELSTDNICIKRSIKKY
jgi:hypothetical protein